MILRCCNGNPVSQVLQGICGFESSTLSKINKKGQHAAYTKDSKHYGKKLKNNSRKPVLRIWDAYPGSRVEMIPDLRSGSASKTLRFLTQKIDTSLKVLNYMIREYVHHPGSGFFPSRIEDPDPRSGSATLAETRAKFHNFMLNINLCTLNEPSTLKIMATPTSFSRRFCFR